ncbi:MAG: peptidoglycan-binding protein [Reyranella sp.]|nr:peptidoglycan-binding protein [Reyranella sp.]
MRRALMILGFAALLPGSALGQSASEVERCFQNPAGCAAGGASPAQGPAAAGAPAAAARTAVPDYASVLQRPDVDRKRIQESLRTLDKYNGPIDGDLQSEATRKAIGDWQKGHGAAAVGKLTPAEVEQLNAEASKAPIRRIEPSTRNASTPAQPSNAETLKALEAKWAERRKAAEPKAEAAAQSLVRDLRAYVAADGKGVVGEQFAAFAKWYADNKAAGRRVGVIAPLIDDYGDGKSGAAATAEVRFVTKLGPNTFPQCLVFAWIEATPRRNTQAFSCDDVAAVEKWKTEQSLRSAWR